MEEQMRAKTLFESLSGGVGSWQKQSMWHGRRHVSEAPAAAPAERAAPEAASAAAAPAAPASGPRWPSPASSSHSQRDLNESVSESENILKKMNMCAFILILLV